MVTSMKKMTETIYYMVTSSKNKEDNTIYMMSSVTETISLMMAVTGEAEMTVVTVTVLTVDKSSNFHIEQQLTNEENVIVIYSLITARR